MAEVANIRCRRCWMMFDPTVLDGVCTICGATDEDFLPAAQRRNRFARLGTYSKIVAGLQWNAAAIDLTADSQAWPGLPEPRRELLTKLVSSFRVAEDAVSEHLTPFTKATDDTLVAWVFFLQRRDEDRHKELFDRIAAEGAGTPAPGAPPTAPAPPPRGPLPLPWSGCRGTPCRRWPRGSRLGAP